jgi:Kef-type K+ transport system membrane component KefB
MALLLGILILLSSMVSVELGLSVAIVEIVLGVVGGNFLGLHTTPWIDWLAGFGGIVLTFLAGAEVDIPVMRRRLKESLLIGGASFLFPFLAAFAYTYYVAHWSLRAAEIAGCALSTTSLAVVYAVLVESGLTRTEIGKIIMASTFVTDIGTVLALSILFVKPNLYVILFAAVSIAVIIAAPRIVPWFFRRYGGRVIEPEIKLLIAFLFLLMFAAKLSGSHAVLPAFVLGLVLSSILAGERVEEVRLRVVAFALLTPFFFLRAGMNVSLKAVAAGIGPAVALFAVKSTAKTAGVYTLSKRYIPRYAMYTNLLMSTGLTFGTISAMYGLAAHIISKSQFSILVAVVIATAVIPTMIAQRWFEPRHLLVVPEEAHIEYEVAGEINGIAELDIKVEAERK